MYRCEVTAVIRQKGVEGYHGIQEFVMKESINRMTVVGKTWIKLLFDRFLYGTMTFFKLLKHHFCLRSWNESMDRTCMIYFEIFYSQSYLHLFDFIYLYMCYWIISELPGPSSNPIITGGDTGGSIDKSGKQFYKPEDLLNLTCTSAPSNPPATLEWRINGLKVVWHIPHFFSISREGVFFVLIFMVWG